MRHILAIHTYGSHRVKHPSTEKMVSAHKIGYTSAAADLLLALYGGSAKDVSSNQASYRYIHIVCETSVRYGYLMLKLSDTELAQAEALTKLQHRAGAYLWRDDVWQHMPDRQNPTYRPTLANTGPNFDPRGYRAVSPSTGEKESVITSITIERSQHDPAKKPWWWIRGETYPHRDLLKSLGCRWSKRRKAWYLIAETVPEVIQQLADEQPPEEASDDDVPCSDAEAEAILGVKLAPKPQETPEVVTQDEAEIPAVRVIAAPQMPESGERDAVQQAILSVTDSPASTPRFPKMDSKTRHKIAQEYVGELTGSISGNVHCYGYAIHDGTLIYLNMGGPKMATEAIRARLAKGEIVNLAPWDAPSIELTAGEGNTGMYRDFSQYISEARFQHTILLHELLLEPNYGGAATTFIIRVSEVQARARLKQHVSELVTCAVFDAWTDYLWQAGHAAMLLRPTRSAGGIDMLTLSLDADAWLRLITGGLAQDKLHLPQIDLKG